MTTRQHAQVITVCMAFRERPGGIQREWRRRARRANFFLTSAQDLPESLYFGRLWPAMGLCERA